MTLHNAGTYVALAIGVPVVLAVFARGIAVSLGRDDDGGDLHGDLIAEILILPLFPAQPKLGPVFIPVTHMIPGAVPGAADGAGARAGSAVAADAGVDAVAGGADFGCGVCGGAGGGGVAVCELSDVQGEREPLLWDDLFRLQLAPGRALTGCAEFFHPTYGAALWWGLAAGQHVWRDRRRGSGWRLGTGCGVCSDEACCRLMLGCSCCCWLA